MNDETIQILIICISVVLVITSFFFLVWDYNKAELINFDETDFGYRKCIGECNLVSGNNGKTHLDEVQCIKDCNTFYYNQDASCTSDESEDNNGK